MRAKRNNKGYSLVELLITIAIFGMVMIGIAMIMRTSSVSYVKGNSEVAMQTEVQIVANQLEEMFVDADNAIAKSYITSGELAGFPYWKIPKGGYNYYVCFDSVENELLFQKRASGGGVLVNRNAWSLMAEYVTGFDVSGWEQRQDDVEPTAACDNKITFELAMDNNGYAYEVSRDVFFRNAIEDALVYEIQEVGGGGGEEDSVIQYKLNRYAVLDLEKEFGITTVTGVSSVSSTENTFDSFYRFVEPTYNDVSNKEPAFSIKSVKDDDDRSECCIMLKSNFYDDLGLEVFDTYGIVVTGTDEDGKVIEVQLITDDVAFVADNNAVHITTSAGGDYNYTFIKVEGIDVAAMLAISDDTTDANKDTTGRPFQYSLAMYSTTDKESPSYSPTGSNKPSVGIVSNVIKHTTGDCMVETINNCSQDCDIRVKIGLRADPGSNGFVLMNTINGMYVGGTGQTNLNAGNMRIAVMVHFPYQTNNESHMVYDIPVLGQGNALATYAPVQTYDAAPATFGTTFNVTEDLSTSY